MKALIVEPSRMIRNVLASLFAKNNVTSVAVETAAEALAALAHEPIDFLCFSMQLGDMTGIEFFVKAKANGLIGKHPSVMLTSSQESITSEAISQGVTECFRKDERAVFEAYVDRWAASGSANLTGHVLLIEDSNVQAGFLTKLLVALGLTVARVATGEEALKIVSQHKFDLVLVDYMLEESITGLGVIRGIRAMSGRIGNLPILAISGFDDVPRRIEMLRSGANDFVHKPVVPEEFQVRVRNLIQLRQALDHLEEQHRILHDMAMQDRLTAVYNRHYLNERMPVLISASIAGNNPLSLIVVDVDHFKRINDNFGHVTGDAVLASIAATLRDRAGDGSMVARLGGEEFIVVLPGSDIYLAGSKAEQLREAIEDLEPSGLPVTASFGVAQLRMGDLYETVFSRADSAMYEAKQDGRNRVVSAE
jgi:two-component system cell cycle response regulator